MRIRQLSVQGVRNLKQQELVFSPRVNLFSGDNGSGKTSLLECIHLLALARSFRSNKHLPIIQNQETQAVVFGLIKTTQNTDSRIGVRRSRQGELEIRIDGQSVKTISALAKILPLQIITPDSFLLLEGSPKLRRQFLDWGVFHVEQSFLQHWQRMQTSIKQRNTCLRHAIMDNNLLSAWDLEFCNASEQIDHLRQQYIKQLKPAFTSVLSNLIELPELSISYYRGWDKDRDLASILKDNRERDRKLGYTQAGPHRADIRIRIGNSNATETLSRGQQKLVVCALKLAQGVLLSQNLNGNCIFLLDDLPSELDAKHRQAVAQLLEQMQCQIFITGTDQEILKQNWSKDTPLSMFHVEHGKITAIGAKE